MPVVLKRDKEHWTRYARKLKISDSDSGVDFIT